MDKTTNTINIILKAASLIVGLIVFLALIIGFGMRPGEISINFGPVEIKMESPTKEPSLPLSSPIASMPQSNIEPSPIPETEYVYLDLQKYSELTEPETNLGLPSGTNSLSDIPFVNGWKATTQCTSMPDRPTSISVDTNISKPIAVYVLFQAGWGITTFYGQQVGVIDLYFSEGNLEEILTLGYNIRDWARNKSDAVSTISSPMVAEVWRGTLPDGVIGGMDVLTILIPDGYKQSTMTRFILLDTTLTTTGNMNPCVHLLAVTILHMK